jgi:hypothetical protein
MANSVAESAPSYRGLLALVIVLGVLIVLGMGALITAAILRAGRPAAAGEPYRAAIVAPGERIESTQIDGNRILLRLSGPNGEELVVVDAATGRVIGRIAVNAKP